MSKKFKMMRAAAGYQPGSSAEYEKLTMHHAAQMSVYQTHTRTIRELGPVIKGKRPRMRARPLPDGQWYSQIRTGVVRRVVSRTVEKIMYGRDGRTPLSPVWRLVDAPGGTAPESQKIHVPQTQLIPIAAPIRLKKGSPKSVYRLLKRIERVVGLDVMFEQLRAAATQEAA